MILALRDTPTRQSYNSRRTMKLTFWKVRFFSAAGHRAEAAHARKQVLEPVRRGRANARDCLAELTRQGADPRNHAPTP